MEHSFKLKVTEQFNAWMAENPGSRTLSAFAEEHEVPKLYMSLIKNGVYVKDHGNGKKTVIDDEYFNRIAFGIGMITRSGTGLHWETNNFRMVQKICKQAQNRRLRSLLEGGTGHGKTYALEYFAIHTDKVIYIKVTRSMTERNLLEAILKKLGIKDMPRGNREKLNTIRHILTAPGYLLILDEVEYARKTLWHVFKEVADFLENKCGFILSGCGVIKVIQRAADKAQMGFPQLRRRFFPNRMLLPERIENSEKRSILEAAGITEKTAVNVIVQYANDFDMLSQMVIDITAKQKSTNSKITGEEVMAMFRDSLD